MMASDTEQRGAAPRGTRGLLAVLCGCALWACATAPKQADPVPAAAPAAAAAPVATPEKPVELTLRIDAISGSKGALSLQPGDSLRSGDQIAINVAVDQPAP